MQSFYTVLDFQELLEISGEDSEKFLQGQLTCDLDDLAEEHLTLGAMCNNKGRVYASFRLLRHAGAYYMTLPAKLLEPTRQNLQKYIPFYKAAISDATSRYQRYGLAGAAAQDYLAATLPRLPAAGESVASGDDLVLNLGGTAPRYEIWSPAGDSALVRGLGSLGAGSAADWRALDVQAGIFLVEIADVGEYTPEETSMDLAGFVSFDKGCYTGQEIVARMHYRGKAGKRLYLVTFPGGMQVLDTALKDSSGKTLGNVSNILYLNDISFGNVVLKTDTDLAQLLYMTTDKGQVAVTVSPIVRA